MRAIFFLSTALFLATPAIAQTQAPSPATLQLPMHIGGRAVPDASGRGVFSQWPGMYYEASFNGTGVTVRLNDAINHLRIYIDGKLVDEEQKPGQGDIDFGPLTAGPHTIRLQKISESQGDSAADFPGFFVAQVLRPCPHRRHGRVRSSLLGILTRLAMAIPLQTEPARKTRSGPPQTPHRPSAH